MVTENNSSWSSITAAFWLNPAKMFLWATISTLVASNVLALPELDSDIGSELSGEHCPRNITFTCNALNFGPNGLIAWFIGDTQLAFYRHSDSGDFPKDIAVNTSILNASVQILSSQFDNNQFSYANFTLTVDLNDLLLFEGQNITCGTMTKRSNAVSISSFTILENSVENVSYLAKYHGAEGELQEISVQWIDQFQLAKCEVTTSYIVKLLSSEGEVSKIILTTKNCTNGECSVQFSSNLKNAVSYEVTLVADNKYNFRSTAFMNTTGNLISFNTCNKTATIKCSTSANENCSVFSNDSTSPAILMPGETDLLTFSTTPDIISITITINSTILTQIFNLDRGSTTGDNKNVVVVGVGVAVFIFGFIIFVIGCILGIFIKFSKFQNTANKDYRYMFWVTLSLSIIAMVIFIVTLVLWIIVGSTSSLDICGKDTIYKFPILLPSIVFSFVFVIIGVMVLGGYIVAFKCICSENKEKVQFINYKVQFGSKGPKVRIVADKCGTCNEHYSNFSKNKHGEKVFADKQQNLLNCRTCYESVCDKCSKVVYLKYCKQKGEVCKNCYKNYKVEQKKISGLPQFGKNQPPKVPMNKQCYECGIGEGENGCKWGTTEEYTAEILSCAACGHWKQTLTLTEHHISSLPSLLWPSPSRQKPFMETLKNCQFLRFIHLHPHNNNNKLPILQTDFL